MASSTPPPPGGSGHPQPNPFRTAAASSGLGGGGGAGTNPFELENEQVRPTLRGAGVIIRVLLRRRRRRRRRGSLLYMWTCSTVQYNTAAAKWCCPAFTPAVRQQRNRQQLPTNQPATQSSHPLPTSIPHPMTVMQDLLGVPVYRLDAGASGPAVADLLDLSGAATAAATATAQPPQSRTPLTDWQLLPKQQAPEPTAGAAGSSSSNPLAAISTAHRTLSVRLGFNGQPMSYQPPLSPTSGRQGSTAASLLGGGIGLTDLDFESHPIDMTAGDLARLGVGGTRGARKGGAGGEVGVHGEAPQAGDDEVRIVQVRSSGCWFLCACLFGG